MRDKYPDELDEILTSLYGKITQQHAEDLKQRLLVWRDREIIEELVKTVLAGMPELTPRQQEYITNRLSELKNKGEKS